MTGLWNSLVGGNEKEVAWPEVSTLYLDNKKKYFSVSEIDQEVVPIVFSEGHKISFNKAAFGYNFTPTNFITIYHIDTRKGLYLTF